MDELAAAVRERTAGLFVGAGVSMPLGTPAGAVRTALLGRTAVFVESSASDDRNRNLLYRLHWLWQGSANPMGGPRTEVNTAGRVRSAPRAAGAA